MDTIVRYTTCRQHDHLDRLSFRFDLPHKLRRAGKHATKWECAQCGRRNNAPRPMAKESAPVTEGDTHAT
jgi:hypothetical protein